MKKIYLGFLLSICAANLLAQNFVVADYESANVSDVVPSLNKWGTADQISATVETTIAPTTGALNSSAKTAKVLPINWDSYLYTDITLPNGKAATDYTHLNLKFYSTDITWKSVIVLAKVGTGDIFQISSTTESNHVKDVSSKWINISVTLDPVQLATINSNSFQLIYGVNVNSGTYYVDNVELSNFNSAVEQSTYDIKMVDYDLCTANSIMPIWSRWGQTDAIFAEVDPVPGTGNSSSKACKVTVLNYDQHLAFDVVLPSGKTIADYESLTLDAYIDMSSTIAGKTSDGQWKNWNTFAKIGAADYFSITSTVPSTGGIENDKVWTNVVIPIDQAKAAAITGNSFKLIFGISTPQAYYWVDNVVLKAKATQTAIKSTTSGSQILAGKGAITVKGAEGKSIEVLSVTGALAAKSNAGASSETFKLNTGMYIVVVDGKATKVFVK